VSLPPAPPPTAEAETRAKLRVRGGTLGGGLSAFAGIVPSAILGAHVFGEIEWDAMRALAPALRVSGTFFGEHEFASTGGTATFSAIVPRMEICPLRLGSPSANVRPCAFASVAIVESSGRNTQRPGTEVHGVWMPGLSAIATVRVVGPLEIFGFAGAGVAMNRYEYAFRAHDPSMPATDVYTTALIEGYGGGGLALGFP
jgi:hypothetical protein